MAKRSAASEINGFISIKPDKSSSSIKKSQKNNDTSKTTSQVSKKKDKDEKVDKVNASSTSRSKNENELARKITGNGTKTVKEDEKTRKLVENRAKIAREGEKARNPGGNRTKITKEDEKTRKSTVNGTKVATVSSTTTQKPKVLQTEKKGEPKQSLKSSSTGIHKNKIPEKNESKRIPRRTDPKRGEVLQEKRKSTTVKEVKQDLMPKKQEKITKGMKTLMTPRQRTFVKEDEPKDQKGESIRKSTEHKEKLSKRNITHASKEENTSTVKYKKTEVELPTGESESEQQNAVEVLSNTDRNSEENEYEYEDDFEDYESDFEEDLESGLDENEPELLLSSSENESGDETKNSTSKKVVEEERKLDSGNYDLTLKDKFKDSESPTESKEYKGSPYTSFRRHKEEELFRTTSFREIKDETEDSRISSEEPTNVVYRHNIYDFSSAAKKERMKKQQDTENLNFVSRGKLLLSMIRLDEISFSVLDMPALPYDVFIKYYGKSNTYQVGTQTNEDNPSEESQTDYIITENKWTQHPVEFHQCSNFKDQLTTFLEDREGVGSDRKKGVQDLFYRPKYNKEKLSDFINSAGEVMCILLEENKTADPSGNIMEVSQNKVDFGFSEGFISLDIDHLQFLKGRIVTHTLFSPHHPFHLLSAHQKSEQAASQVIDAYYNRCILCLWNILEPSQPLKMLVAPLEVSSLCFDAVHMKFVYGGLVDGSICVWDLSERIVCHNQSLPKEVSHVLRSPTFCTSAVMGELNHFGLVVSIKSVGYKKVDKDAVQDWVPTQVISLDESGKVNIWTTIQVVQSSKIHKISLADLGMAPWGNVKLVCTTTLTPMNLLLQMGFDFNLEFTCMTPSPVGEQSVLIGTNIGVAVRCMLSGIKRRPEIFQEFSDDVSIVNCIEPRPGDLPIFLVGCSNGKIRLHGLSRSKPLLVFSGNENSVGSPIDNITWSSQKPGLFFVADKKSRIHVWDLCKGDLYPQFTVPFTKEKITSMAFTSIQNPSYLALAMTAAVHVHPLKKIYSSTGSPEDQKDCKLFNLYIKIL